MNSFYREQVAAAVKAAQIHSASCYSWFGCKSLQFSRTIRKTLTAAQTRMLLTEGLQMQLYANFYATGVAIPASSQAKDSSPLAATRHMQKLSKANSGSGYWENGWRLEEIHDDWMMAGKEGLRIFARRGRDRELEKAPANGFMRLRMPKEFLSRSPGFYVANGDKVIADENSQPLVRFYWNLTVDGGIFLMRTTTAMFNSAGIAFQLKVLKDPCSYSRCDAGVLYLQKRELREVAPLLGEIHRAIAGELRPLVPSFTQKAADGLGFAEDPGTGESFGQHRCRILAEGIVRAYERGIRQLDNRMNMIETCFEEAGIGLDSPFLNAGSTCLDLCIGGRRRLRSRHVSARDTPVTASRLLIAADEIGRALCKKAIRHQNRCNWIGVSPNASSLGPAVASSSYSALGPEFYSGTAGIAWFLIALHAANGDAATREIACAAIRQSLSAVDSVSPSARFGLYSGWTGIALTAARAGTVLHNEELLTLTRKLVQRLNREDRSDREFDLISGRAGGILGLIVLRNILDDDRLVDLAVSLGDELIEMAETTGGSYSWRTAGVGRRRNLTGFSHGAAGVGHALLELFQLTGAAKYHDAGRQAFDYERGWFDSRAANWPDFRVSQSGRGGVAGSGFANAWCHGAPGIALSRLRAYRLLKDKTCKGEASTALETTRRSIRAMLDTGGANFCLCHGLAGNADILLCASDDAAEDESEAYRNLAEEVATRCIQYAPESGGGWPGCIDAPGLMVGWAGIGSFYLRLRDGAVPSALLLRSESFFRKEV